MSGVQLRRRPGVRSQFIHDRINGVHVACVNFATGISVWKMLDKLVHGWLIVTDGRRESINSLLADGLVRVFCGQRNENWHSVHDNKLFRHVVSFRSLHQDLK